MAGFCLLCPGIIHYVCTSLISGSEQERSIIFCWLIYLKPYLTGELAKRVLGSFYICTYSSIYINFTQISTG